MSGYGRRDGDTNPVLLRDEIRRLREQIHHLERTIELYEDGWTPKALDNLWAMVRATGPCDCTTPQPFTQHDKDLLKGAQ